MDTDEKPNDASIGNSAVPDSPFLLPFPPSLAVTYSTYYLQKSKLIRQGQVQTALSSPPELHYQLLLQTTVKYLVTFAHCTHMAPVGTLSGHLQTCSYQRTSTFLIWTESHTECLQVYATLSVLPFLPN